MGILSLLAACGTPKVQEPPPIHTLPGYEAIEDEGFAIPAVDPRLLTDGYQKAEVAYTGSEAPGTIVVDTFARKLYFVEEGGMATRYGIAVGREGLSFRGSGVVGRKEKWPSWQPTANMVRTRPDLYLEYAGGMKGGLDNPLGARAMYLYRGGRDTYFRIHGTIDNNSIGHATSAGCIRLFNQDAIELFDRVKLGTKIKVRTLEESIAAEGPYMDDAYGRAIPDTPENQAKKVKEAAALAAAEAANPELAAYDAAARAAEEAAKRQAQAAGGN
ncbi:L,D-transpeptidase family protein [bacterium]|nr:L,D-transpeptidase family protein [bacterium]